MIMISTIQNYLICLSYFDGKNLKHANTYFDMFAYRFKKKCTDNFISHGLIEIILSKPKTIKFTEKGLVYVSMFKNLQKFGVIRENKIKDVIEYPSLNKYLSFIVGNESKTMAYLSFVNPFYINQAQKESFRKKIYELEKLHLIYIMQPKNTIHVTVQGNALIKTKQRYNVVITR